MNAKKVIILLMDSFGIGYSKDAVNFGDVGSNTLLHIIEYFNNNNLDFKLENLSKRGLSEALRMSSNNNDFKPLSGSDVIENAKYGYCSEISKGKDTPSGHWEIAGSPVLTDWHYFDKVDTGSCFPSFFLESLANDCGIKNGFIDAGHASGTEVLKQYGEEHCKSKKPIIYTSGDSVFQIAAHEECFGLEKLYDLCITARKLLDEHKLNIGRVIARPFIGDNSSNFERTGNRHDYSVLPPTPTLLDKISNNGGNVISVGKIADIYAHQGITEKHKATGLQELFDKTLECYKNSSPNSLIFTNFVDFDSSYGHRRDIKGYGEALKYFDSRLVDLDKILDDETLVIVAADHGCDPSWPGTDHTRENIPFLVWGNNVVNENIGPRSTFADIGQSIADFMGIEKLDYGKSIFDKSGIDS